MRSVGIELEIDLVAHLEILVLIDRRMNAFVGLGFETDDGFGAEPLGQGNGPA